MITYVATNIDWIIIATIAALVATVIYIWGNEE